MEEIKTCFITAKDITLVDTLIKRTSNGIKECDIIDIEKLFIVNKLALLRIYLRDADILLDPDQHIEIKKQMRLPF